jgi:hypothetical protein
LGTFLAAIKKKRELNMNKKLFLAAVFLTFSFVGRAEHASSETRGFSPDGFSLRHREVGHRPEGLGITAPKHSRALCYTTCTSQPQNYFTNYGYPYNNSYNPYSFYTTNPYSNYMSNPYSYNSYNPYAYTPYSSGTYSPYGTGTTGYPSLVNYGTPSLNACSPMFYPYGGTGNCVSPTNNYNMGSFSNCSTSLLTQMLPYLLNNGCGNSYNRCGWGALNPRRHHLF